MTKVNVKCFICDKEIEIEFALPPTKDDKIGYVCDECEAKYNYTEPSIEDVE